MTEPRIRALADDEVETLARLAREIWHAHYPGIISWAQIDFMLDQRYRPSVIRAAMPGQYWAAAWLEERMVGFAHAFPDEPCSTWKLDKLYVHPDFQRKGIGQALLQAVGKSAAGAGATRLVLRVNRHNSIALAAYAKYGFRVYGEDVLDIGDGFVMDDYLLKMGLCS